MQGLAQLPNESDPKDGYYKFYKLFIDAFSVEYNAARNGLDKLLKIEEKHDGLHLYGHLGNTSKGRMSWIKKLNFPEEII